VVNPHWNKGKDDTDKLEVGLNVVYGEKGEIKSQKGTFINSVGQGMEIALHSEALKLERGEDRAKGNKQGPPAPGLVGVRCKRKKKRVKTDREAEVHCTKNKNGKRKRWVQSTTRSAKGVNRQRKTKKEDRGQGQLQSVKRRREIVTCLGTRREKGRKNPPISKAECSHNTNKCRC